MSKFKLNDIVSFNIWTGPRKGVIKAFFAFSENGYFRTEYEIFYQEEIWYSNLFPGTDPKGKVATTIRLEEKELTLIEGDRATLEEIFGLLFINTASGEDLDKMAHEFDVLRRTVPSGSISKLICEHSWTTYEGLISKFDYCEKCDLKR